MRLDDTTPRKLIERFRTILSHLGRGFSLIIAPHDTGTTVTFNLPGKLASLLAVVVAVIVIGLAFVGVTYTRLASLAFETAKLKAENRSLRLRSQKIEHIEQELVRIEQLRREIEAWAGVVPQEATAPEPETDAVLVPRTWPRRYSYALMEPYYTFTEGRSRGMVQPATGWVSRRFTEAGAEAAGHYGIDIAAPEGSPVRCADDGVVKSARWDDIYGNVIEIQHDDSLSTVYGHNEKILVKEGDHVTRGQVIATVGNTGRSTAPHLHFEVLKNGKPSNPEDYVTFKSE
jgi:murein DD-endopeptidase MepM/ murein hydrolase activator NlpD